MFEQIAAQVGTAIAADFARNPAGAIQGMNDFMQALCPHHHTAEDVAQDALDAYEAGNMSREACLAIVQIVVADVERNRIHQPQQAPWGQPAPAPSLALKEQTATEVRTLMRRIA